MQTWQQPLSILLISSLSTTALAASEGEAAHAPAGLVDQPLQEAKTDNTVINAYFKDGLRFSTPDKSFQLKIGTRIAFDNNFIATNRDYGNLFGEEEDGARFRFARISAEGSLHEKIEFKYSYDFAGGVNNRLKDVYVGFRKVWCGNLR